MDKTSLSEMLLLSFSWMEWLTAASGKVLYPHYPTQVREYPGLGLFVSAQNNFWP